MPTAPTADPATAQQAPPAATKPPNANDDPKLGWGADEAWREWESRAELVTALSEGQRRQTGNDSEAQDAADNAGNKSNRHAPKATEPAARNNRLGSPPAPIREINPRNSKLPAHAFEMNADPRRIPRNLPLSNQTRHAQRGKIVNEITRRGSRRRHAQKHNQGTHTLTRSRIQLARVASVNCFRGYRPGKTPRDASHRAECRGGGKRDPANRNRAGPFADSFAYVVARGSRSSLATIGRSRGDVIQQA